VPCRSSTRVPLVDILGKASGARLGCQGEEPDRRPEPVGRSRSSSIATVDNLRGIPERRMVDQASHRLKSEGVQ
jgi:hypothetical protein